MIPRGGKRVRASDARRTTLDERTIRRLEKEHGEGLSAAQIVDAFTEQGVRLSEATFRKWVQLGLLPRSRRVGSKGKHKGSRGLYPAGVLARINLIKERMAEDLTVEEIGHSLQFRDEIETLHRGITQLLARFGGKSLDGLDAAEKKARERLVVEAQKHADELVRRLENLERRVVAPLERAARRRAFGAGSAGGAADLL